MSESTIKAISSNTKIAQIAMDVAEEHERKQGRNPKPLPHKRGLGYDIESGDRKIEVKGTSWTWDKNKSSFQYISENERTNATHIYLVCNVQEKPELHIFEMKKIHKALVPEVRYMLYFSRCRDDESEELKSLRS
jgi:hypothetical protein